MNRKRSTVSSTIGAILLTVAVLSVSPGLAAQTGGKREMGTVKIPWDRFDLLVIDARNKAAHHNGVKGVCRVPAGQYPRYRLTLTAKDRKGGTWQMSSGYWYEPLTVTPGQTTELAIHAPFTARVLPSRYRARAGGNLSLSLDVRDSAGHEWRLPRSSAGRSRNLRPKFKVTFGAKAVATEQFEYG